MKQRATVTYKQILETKKKWYNSEVWSMTNSL